MAVSPVDVLGSRGGIHGRAKARSPRKATHLFPSSDGDTCDTKHLTDLLQRVEAHYTIPQMRVAYARVRSALAAGPC